jgi:hypothetical protein
MSEMHEGAQRGSGTSAGTNGAGDGVEDHMGSAEVAGDEADVPGEQPGRLADDDRDDAYRGAPARLQEQADEAAAAHIATEGDAGR